MEKEMTITEALQMLAGTPFDESNPEELELLANTLIKFAVELRLRAQSLSAN